LCNATTIGIAYDALVSFGHAREQDLPIDNAWPPIVIGLDEGTEGFKPLALFPAV
jgi:D-aminopeptidase